MDIIYYSDWFEVDCVYPNLITSWASSNYDHWDPATGTTGTALTRAEIDTGPGNCHSHSSTFTLRAGENITVIFDFADEDTAEHPVVMLFDDTGTTIDTSATVS